MGKLSDNERNSKISYAKSLYVKGFDTATIADMLGFAKSTIESWAKQADFEQAKRASNISISEIRNEILKTYEAMRNGKKPTINPDQISKLVASFEKLSPNQKSVTWIIEAFELLTESYLKEMHHTKNQKKRQQILNQLKVARIHADKVMSKLTKDLLT